jgi:hypothetical protein
VVRECQDSLWAFAWRMRRLSRRGIGGPEGARRQTRQKE